jgi:hypothetical protein
MARLGPFVRRLAARRSPALVRTSSRVEDASDREIVEKQPVTVPCGARDLAGSAGDVMSRGDRL